MKINSRKQRFYAVGFSLLAIASLIAAVMVSVGVSRTTNDAPAARSAATDPNYGQVPLAIVPVLDRGVAALFQAQGLMGTLLFEPHQVALKAATRETSVVFENAQTQSVVGTDPQAGRVNYLQGNDAARWRTDVPLYVGVRYHELYPGIDLDYAGVDGTLKGTYTIAAGADPAVIRWHYTGATAVQIDAASGDLLITIGDRSLREAAPTAWQDIAGERQPIKVSYAIGPENSLRFVIESCDSAYPLVIDPYLIYSTFIGGSGIMEAAYNVAVDADGNAYITGFTSSPDFPHAGQPQPSYGGGSVYGDAFVVKLDASGRNIIYATYLGGSGEDAGDAIAVDADRNVYITGMTESINFPTVNAYQATRKGNRDAFVAKLNPAGNALVFSTYLGGSDNENAGLLDAGDARSNTTGIAVDGSGNVYLTGNTDSDNFPTVNGYRTVLKGSDDLFVTKLSADGQTLLYSTYFGSDAYDYSGRLALDGNGNVVVAGTTGGADTFPKKNALQSTPGGMLDAVFFKINPALSGANSLVFSSLFGGSDDDYAFGMAVDSSGNIYLDGYTFSLNFPVKNAYQTTNASTGAPLPRDAWAAKINAAGTTLLYSTYLGGAGLEVTYALAINGQGDIYLAGRTLSDNFPVKDAWQAGRGDSEIFLTRLNPTQSGAASLIYSTYLGGMQPSNDYAYGVAVDNAGSVYVVGEAGYREDFPFYTLIGDDNAGAYISKFTANSTRRVYLPLTKR